MAKLIKKKEPYIMLGIPARGFQTSIDFVDCLMGLDFPCKWTKLFVKGSLISANRDVIVNEALKRKATHILWIDDDTTFPPDALVKLLQHDVDICSGVVYSKSYDECTPCAWTNLQFNDLGELSSAETIKQIPKFGEVGLVGLGFCLVKTQVYEDVRAKFGKYHAHAFNVGEDFAFMLRAKECGYSIYIDGTIPLGHVGQYVFDHRDYYRCSMARRIENDRQGIHAPN